MPRKINKLNPVWFEKRWTQRKQETIARVKNAVQALVKEGRPISVRSICSKVREQTGHSLSPNTIKQNAGAYEIYRQHASHKPTYNLKGCALLALLNEIPDSKRDSLKAKIIRLKKHNKENLIAHLIKLEEEIKESKNIENKLRERLFELEMFAHKNKQQSS